MKQLITLFMILFVCAVTVRAQDNRLDSVFELGSEACDSDNDGVPDHEDVCPGGDDQLDIDLDGVPAFCDVCPGFDDKLDADNDLIPDGCDEFSDIANPPVEENGGTKAGNV